jgi:hypothetical protein
MSLSRRRLIALSAGAAAAAQLGLPGAGWAKESQGNGHDPVGYGNGGHGKTVDRRLDGPVSRGYQYLDFVMDAYAQGDEIRLLQSYNNESGLMTTAFVYDNALAAIAYLSRPTWQNVKRAKVIGDTLLWIQANDEAFADGRVRQAYAAGPMIFYGWSPEFPGLVRSDGKAAFLWPFGFSGSSTGDVAWSGLALAQLYGATRQRKYLDGAVAIGEWIKLRETGYRYGGFHGGLQGDGVTPQTWCSTEHNIDVYALFELLARYTKDRSWKNGVREARSFLEGMWNREGQYFWTGTQQASPDEINKSILPEDVNTWAYLAMGDRWIGPSLDWNAANLDVTDGAIQGVTFSDVARNLSNAVWPEGNGHMAAALLERGHGRPDRDKALHYLLETVEVQNTFGAGQTVGRTSDPNNGRLSNPGEGGNWTGSPLPARAGIVSATKDLDTGFGFSYFANQHLGATAWFLMAAQSINPYREL